MGVKQSCTSRVAALLGRQAIRYFSEWTLDHPKSNL